MARFLCLGDLHVGAGADLLDGDERLDEQEAVLDWIVTQANEINVSLLFAGDAWERRRPTPAEILAVMRPLSRLRNRAIVIPGNHDVEAWGRPTGFDLFDDQRIDYAPTPRIVVTHAARIACLPWAPPSRLVALEGGGNRDALLERLSAGLVEIARGLFAEMKDDGEPRILLTHWSISGATASSGAPVDLFREPILPIGELEEIGFDAIVAGHIHRPQMLGERGFYVGSPMPLNFGEAGHDHSVWLLDVDGSRTSTAHRFGAFQIPVPSRPLVTLDVDVSPAGGWPVIAGVDGAIVKARLRMTEEQARRVDVGSLKAEILAAGARKVWAIQSEIERAELVRGVAVDETLGDVEAMELYLEAEGIEGDRLEGLLERHVNYLERIGR